MNMLAIEQATLNGSIEAARDGRVILTRDGEPVALLVNVEGLDAEQIELGSSAAFWSLINTHRTEKRLTRAELKQRLNSPEA